MEKRCEFHLIELGGIFLACVIDAGNLAGEFHIRTVFDFCVVGVNFIFRAGWIVVVVV
jgi:hypothetical protein